MEPGAASVPEHVRPEEDPALTVPVPTSTSDSVAPSAKSGRNTFMSNPLFWPPPLGDESEALYLCDKRAVAIVSNGSNAVDIRPAWQPRGAGRVEGGGGG